MYNKIVEATKEIVTKQLGEEYTVADAKVSVNEDQTITVSFLSNNKSMTLNFKEAEGGEYEQAGDVAETAVETPNESNADVVNEAPAVESSPNADQPEGSTTEPEAIVPETIVNPEGEKTESENTEANAKSEGEMEDQGAEPVEEEAQEGQAMRDIIKQTVSEVMATSMEALNNKLTEVAGMLQEVLGASTDKMCGAKPEKKAEEMVSEADPKEGETPTEEEEKNTKSVVETVKVFGKEYTKDEASRYFPSLFNK
jgi:hypothetical protein